MPVPEVTRPQEESRRRKTGWPSEPRFWAMAEEWREGAVRRQIIDSHLATQDCHVRTIMRDLLRRVAP